MKNHLQILNNDLDLIDCHYLTKLVIKDLLKEIPYILLPYCLLYNDKNLDPLDEGYDYRNEDEFTLIVNCVYNNSNLHLYYHYTFEEKIIYNLCQSENDLESGKIEIGNKKGLADLFTKVLKRETDVGKKDGLSTTAIAAS